MKLRKTKKSQDDKIDWMFKHIGFRKMTTKFRLVAIEEYSKYADKYVEKLYFIEVKFILNPFKWYRIGNSYSSFSEALAEKRNYLLLQDRPMRKVVITKEMEVIKLIQEQERE